MKFKTLLCTGILLSSLFANARGNEIGNGGLGIVIDQGKTQNNVWLLDFAENGIADAVYDTSVPVNPEILQRVHRKLDQVLCNNARLAWAPNAICEKVAQKFSELLKIEPLIFNTYFYSFENLDFRLVEAGLVPTEDIGQSPIEYDNKLLRQLATRINNVVRFNRSLIDKNSLYNEDQLVGLVFHESFYAVRSSSIQEPLPVARNIREAIGYLFGNKNIDLIALELKLPHYIPNADSVTSTDPGSWSLEKVGRMLVMNFLAKGARARMNFGYVMPAIEHSFKIDQNFDPAPLALVSDYCKRHIDRTSETRIWLDFEGAEVDVSPGISVGNWTGMQRGEGHTFGYNLDINEDLSNSQHCIQRVTVEVNNFVRKVLQNYKPLSADGIYR